MSLAGKFERKLSQVLKLHAVWEPGSAVELGDVMVKKGGVFTDVASLTRDFGVRFRRTKASDRSLAFESQGVSVTLLQAGVAVGGPDALDKSKDAEVKIEFRREETFVLRTPELRGAEIDDLLQVGQKLRERPDWRPGDYHVVWKLLEAKQFTFLGNVRKNRSVSFSGKGAAIAKFVTFGLGGGIERTSGGRVDVEILGTGGPVAIGLARIGRSGKPRIV